MSEAAYSRELYDAIAAFGVHRNAAILDVACADGVASEPFAQNGFPVTGVDESEAALEKARARVPQATFVRGTAAGLPFPNARFDVVLCAQSIYLMDRFAALREMARVIKPLGMIAIWWKQLMANDGVREIRERVYADAGLERPVEGLSGGFREFYASEELRDQMVRVFPWRRALSVETFVRTESPQVQAALERALRERLPEGTDLLDLPYVQYLYLARRR